MSEKEVRGLSEDSLDNVSGGFTSIAGGFNFRDNEFLAMKNQLGNDKRFTFSGNSVYVNENLSKHDKELAMNDLKTLIHDLNMKEGLDAVRY